MTKDRSTEIESVRREPNGEAGQADWQAGQDAQHEASEARMREVLDAYATTRAGRRDRRMRGYRKTWGN